MSPESTVACEKSWMTRRPLLWMSKLTPVSIVAVFESVIVDVCGCALNTPIWIPLCALAFVSSPSSVMEADPGAPSAPRRMRLQERVLADCIEIDAVPSSPAFTKSAARWLPWFI
jgi:hypothetical protein